MRRTHADDGTLQARERCKKKRTAEQRKSCLQAYLELKQPAAVQPSLATASHFCGEPSDDATKEERLRMDQCLHGKEVPLPGDWLHHHLWHEPGECVESRTRPLQPASAVQACLRRAGDANWTASGLSDGRPECGRTWVRTSCARQLFAGRDALFIGNSVIRRQMFTLVDLLAGPSVHLSSPQRQPSSSASTSASASDLTLNPQPHPRPRPHPHPHPGTASPAQPRDRADETLDGQRRAR